MDMRKIQRLSDYISNYIIRSRTKTYYRTSYKVVDSMPRVKKYEDRNCVICLDGFTTEISNERGRNRKTCGERKCQDALRLQTTYDKKCEACNEPYNTVRLNSKFCSLKCRRKRHKLSCGVCKSQFRADRPEIRFCSKECQNEHQVNNMKSIKCSYCEADVKRKSSHIFKNQNNFCDATCSNNFWAYKLFAGKSKYGGEWGTIRKKTLAFYNKECQKCFLSITLRTCNIHHIIPIHYFDKKIKIANSIENLLPLCKACHKDVHKNNNGWYEEKFGDSKFLKI